MKNKGFTLVELLAVFVVLAIIALIAVPIIQGILERTEVKSNERSIELYANAIKQAVARYQLNNANTPEVGDYQSSNDGYTLTKGNTTLNIEYDGNKVVCKTVQIKEDGTVYLASCKVNGENVSYTYGEKTKVCKLTLDQNKNGEAELSDEITCGTETFHVMFNENDEITMLAKYNLEVGYIGEPINGEYKYTLINSIGIQNEKAVGYVGYSTDYAYGIVQQNEIMKYVKQYEEYLYNELNVNLINVDLITHNQLQKLGCSYTDYVNGFMYMRCNTSIYGVPSWIHTTTYWTGSPGYIDSDGNTITNSDVAWGDVFANNSATGYSGVRPVITISTDEI